MSSSRGRISALVKETLWGYMAAGPFIQRAYGCRSKPPYAPFLPAVVGRLPTFCQTCPCPDSQGFRPRWAFHVVQKAAIVSAQPDRTTLVLLTVDAQCNEELPSSRPHNYHLASKLRLLRLSCSTAVSRPCHSIAFNHGGRVPHFDRITSPSRTLYLPFIEPLSTLAPDT